MGQIKKTLGKISHWVKKALSRNQTQAHSSPPPSNKPHVVIRADHPISRQHISPSALKVLNRLKKGGFSAFLVGGGVRDLLLGLTPKDFDVATDAKPEEIKKLFSNARLIGKRFRLAHVTFGHETIEVATFRGHYEGNTRTASGLILSDNTYGSQEEDAYRRDFTINSLYYSIADFSLIDYTGGMADVSKRILRLIGDPETRYREDPVRMLRAARLSAKLDLTLEKDTAACIPTLAPLLQQISHSRLSDELLKMFLKGHAQKSFEILEQTGILTVLFPQMAAAIQNHPFLKVFLYHALTNTDRRIAENKNVTTAFLYACLLWPVIYADIHPTLKDYKKLTQNLQSAIQKAIENQNQLTQISRYQACLIRDILELQMKLSIAHRRVVPKLETHPKFRAAYDFLLLRHEAGDPGASLAQWWIKWLSIDADHKKEWIKKLPLIKTRRRKK